MGRPKGALNKSTLFIKDVAQRYGPDCIEALVRIVKHPKCTGQEKARAAEIVLAYGYGKPSQSLEIGGHGGGAVPVSVEGVDEALRKLIGELKGE